MLSPVINSIIFAINGFFTVKEIVKNTLYRLIKLALYMMSNPRKAKSKPIFFRVLIAVIGGYFLANLLSIAFSMLLPASKAEGVGFGMLLSFLFYTLIVMWVFTVESTKKAFWGVSLTGFICLAIIALNKMVFV